MKTSNFNLCILLSIALFISFSCREQEGVTTKSNEAEALMPTETHFITDSTDYSTIIPVVMRSHTHHKDVDEPDTMQISQYIRRIFQDRQGNLWFGTMTDGVCRYDGKALTYYTPNEGFGGWAVQDIAEDKNGSLWFATSGGVSKYDGKNFSNFTEKNGLNTNLVLSLLIDKAGIIWAGTTKGICRCEGGKFIPFSIPGAGKDVEIKNIIQDHNKTIWFASNDKGVYHYDGSGVTNLSKKEGLKSNNVACVMEDKNGNIWLATKEGLCRYNSPNSSAPGVSTVSELADRDASDLYEDKNGNIWISVRGDVYRYDGKSFRKFGAESGLNNVWVQSYQEDRTGNFWLGTSAGLFLFNDKTFANVSKKGAWPKHFR